MKKLLPLFFLFSSFAAPQETHTFESPEFLARYRDELLVIPGAQSNVTSIELHVSFNSKHTVEVENLQPTTNGVIFHANPKVRLGPFVKQLQGFGWSHTLQPFDNHIDFQGRSGTSYDTTVGHTVLFVTITDPQELQPFVGSQVSLPLQFIRANNVTWSAGNNQDRASSVFGWHGLIKYNY
jgi:hypothetical protein